MVLGGVNHEGSVAILENERCEGGLLKGKWRLASFFSERIDSAKNFGMLDQPFFQAMFARKVDKENPQQHRQQALSRQKQHRDSCKQKYNSCHVFDDEAEGSNHGMVVGKPGFVVMVLEVVGRKTNENGWNGDQRAHKGDDRERDQADPHFFGDP